jgi:hypothetical protein
VRGFQALLPRLPPQPDLGFKMCPLVNRPLRSTLLRNPVYVGEIRHKDVEYPGQAHMLALLTL